MIEKKEALTDPMAELIIPVTDCPIVSRIGWWLVHLVPPLVLLAWLIFGASGCTALPLTPEAEKATATWTVEYFLPYPGEIIDDWHVDVDDVAVSGRKAYNVRDAKGVLIDRTWTFSRCMTPQRWARAYPERREAALRGERKTW